VIRRGWLLVPIAALVGTLALAGIGVAQTEISPEELLDRLARAQALARLEGDGPSPERMDEVRATLGLPVELVIGDGAIDVPPDPILEGLSGSDATHFEEAADRLSALERSLTDALAREPASADEIAQALDEAYRGVVPPRPDLLQEVLRIIGEVWEAVIQRFGSMISGAGNALAWIALLLIGAIVVLYLFRARLVPDRVSSVSLAARGASGPVDWAGRAEEALGAGDFHEAVRAMYLALLATLAGRGIVADAPALTAGEARFAVQRRRPALFPAIARATDAYERVIYGGAVPDERDVEQLRDAEAAARRP
jgi:hypothetical protein